jgi:hypothetical protein
MIARSFAKAISVCIMTRLSRSVLPWPPKHRKSDQAARLICALLDRVLRKPEVRLWAYRSATADGNSGRLIVTF